MSVKGEATIHVVVFRIRTEEARAARHAARPKLKQTQVCDVTTSHAHHRGIAHRFYSLQNMYRFNWLSLEWDNYRCMNYDVEL